MKKDTFYKNKRVFITGHTGFKGSWMCKLLIEQGAEVCGYSLEPEADKILFSVSQIDKNVQCEFGDIRDLEKLTKVMTNFKPDILIHMAAQPIVRESYKRPVETYSTNIMGTVHVLEAARKCQNIRSIVNVTTDKVYKNIEQKDGYIEEDILNGYDPYSNSKSCSELVTSSYVNCFFNYNGVAVSTCRAGNVLGGGDFSKDRILPDCYRAAIEKKDIIIRNPDSVRPYQHVLDPIAAYLMIAHKQYEDNFYSGAYNIGPSNVDNIKTKDIADKFCKYWGEGVNWRIERDINAPHEANFLFLNCKKARDVLGWRPIWNINETIANTVEWYKDYYYGKSIPDCMERQLKKFYEDGGSI